MYLAFASRDPNNDVAYTDDNQPGGFIPPEIENSIRKADVRLLRLYAIAIGAVVADKTGLTTNERTALKLCRDRAETLRLDGRVREELSDIFEGVFLPPLNSK